MVRGENQGIRGSRGGNAGLGSRRKGGLHVDRTGEGGNGRWQAALLLNSRAGLAADGKC